MENLTKENLEKLVLEQKIDVYSLGEGIVEELSRRGFDPKMVENAIEERGGLEAYLEWGVENGDELRENYCKLNNLDSSSYEVTTMEEFIDISIYGILTYLGL